MQLEFANEKVFGWILCDISTPEKEIKQTSEVNPKRQYQQYKNHTTEQNNRDIKFTSNNFKLYCIFVSLYSDAKIDVNTMGNGTISGRKY